MALPLLVSLPVIPSTKMVQALSSKVVGGTTPPLPVEVALLLLLPPLPPLPLLALLPLLGSEEHANIVAPRRQVETNDHVARPDSVMRRTLRIGKIDVNSKQAVVTRGGNSLVTKRGGALLHRCFSQILVWHLACSTPAP